MDRTDKFLTAMWLIWGALLIVVFVFYSLLVPKLFGDSVRSAWEWLLPNLLPPMALVAGVSYQQGKKDPAAPTATAIKSTPTLPVVVLSISGFYLLLLTASVISPPFSRGPLETLRLSNLWLGPVLAIATATLATRFAR